MTVRICQEIQTYDQKNIFDPEVSSIQLVKKDLEVGNEEEPAVKEELFFTKGIYKSKKISYFAKFDSSYLKKC